MLISMYISDVGWHIWGSTLLFNQTYCYFMNKLAIQLMARNQSRSHHWTSNYWIPCQTRVGTSIRHRQSMSAGSRHHPMQSVMVNGRRHQRPDPIIVDFETVLGKVLVNPWPSHIVRGPFNSRNIDQNAKSDVHQRRKGSFDNPQRCRRPMAMSQRR